MVWVEPSGELEGMLTGGLSDNDFRSLASLQGMFRDCRERVEQYHGRRYGMDSPQRRDSFFGALAEPHVSRAVLEGMLGEQPTIAVRRRTVLLGAEAAGGWCERFAYAGRGVRSRWRAGFH